MSAIHSLRVYTVPFWFSIFFLFHSRAFFSSPPSDAANNRLETRSSTTDSNHRNQWRFYRRREQQRGEPQPMLLIPKNMSPVQYRNAVASLNEDVAAPAFIYRAADLPGAVERHGGGADLYIQDIADSEYHILDPSKLNVHRYNGTMVRWDSRCVMAYVNVDCSWEGNLSGTLLVLNDIIWHS